MERYVNTTYRLRDLKRNEWYCEFISMYMYSLSVCRISVFSRRAWNALCRGSLCPQALQACCDSHSSYCQSISVSVHGWRENILHIRLCLLSQVYSHVVSKFHCSVVYFRCLLDCSLILFLTVLSVPRFLYPVTRVVFVFSSPDFFSTAFFLKCHVICYAIEGACILKDILRLVFIFLW